MRETDFRGGSPHARRRKARVHHAHRWRGGGVAGGGAGAAAGDACHRGPATGVHRGRATPRPTWMHCARALPTLATSRAEIWRSNIVGEWRAFTVASIGRRSVDRQVAVIVATGGNNSALVAKRRPVQSRSSSQAATTRSNAALSPASIGRGATSLGLAGSTPNSDPRGWGCCTS